MATKFHPMSCPRRQMQMQRQGNVKTLLCLSLLATLVSFTTAEREILSTKPVGMKATALVLGTVSTLQAVLAMVFVIAFRSNKIVTVGQPFFLCLICFGAFLISVSFYFDAGTIEEIEGIKMKTLDRLCVLQMWSVYCGMLVVLFALFCKTWRADKTCQFRKNQRITVRNVIWPFAVILVIEFVLLATAAFICPPYWQEMPKDYFGANITDTNTGNGTDTKMILLDGEPMNADDFVPKCFANPVPAANVLKICSHVLIVIAIILVIWMAYQTRNIPEVIVDTKRVYYLMVFHLVIYVPYLLLQYGVIPSGRFYHYLGCIFPFLFSTTSVGFLVFPKVYYVFYFKRHGRLPDSVGSSIIGSSNKIHVSGTAPMPRGSVQQGRGSTAALSISGQRFSVASASNHSSSRSHWKEIGAIDSSTLPKKKINNINSSVEIIFGKNSQFSTTERTARNESITGQSIGSELNLIGLPAGESSCDSEYLVNR